MTPNTNTIHPKFNINLQGLRKNFNDTTKFCVRELTGSEFLGEQPPVSEFFATEQDAERFTESVLTILSESYNTNFVTESDLRRELAGGRYSSVRPIAHFSVPKHFDLYGALRATGFRVFSICNHSHRHIATIITL